MLQQVKIRGIERRKIFRKDNDPQDMLEQLGTLLSETGTACYAWGFLDNQPRFLFRSEPSTYQRLKSLYLHNLSLLLIEKFSDKLPQKGYEVLEGKCS
jgi:hypothetical protein